MSNPPGHLPGIHYPGTLMPIAAMAAEDKAARASAAARAPAQAQAQEKLRRVRRNHLLLQR